MTTAARPASPRFTPPLERPQARPQEVNLRDECGPSVTEIEEEVKNNDFQNVRAATDLLTDALESHFGGQPGRDRSPLKDIPDAVTWLRDELTTLSREAITGEQRRAALVMGATCDAFLQVSDLYVMTTSGGPAEGKGPQMRTELFKILTIMCDASIPMALGTLKETLGTSDLTASRA